MLNNIETYRYLEFTDLEDNNSNKNKQNFA